jgi:hypothetical protein
VVLLLVSSGLAYKRRPNGATLISRLTTDSRYGNL